MKICPSGRMLALGVAWVWIGLIVVIAVSQSALPIADPLDMDIMAIEATPSSEHWLGADKFGRDILARLAAGAEVSLKLGMLAPLLGLLLGTLLGFVAAWRGGWVDWAISVLNDAVFALPGIAVVAVAIHSFDNKELTLVAVLGLLSVPAFARVARNLTLTHKQKTYVQTAQMMGGGPTEIFYLLILPNIRRSLGAYALIVGSVFIVIEGSLSFLGLGIPAPAASWGSMIAEGRETIRSAPHTLWIPVITLTLTVLAFNVAGEGMKNGR